MVLDPALQWVLTIAFAATAAYSMLRLMRDRSPLILVGHALHLVMSIGMIAMVWPWWSALPVVPQLVVFGGGAAWFTLMLTLQLTHRLNGARLGGHSAWHQVAHAIMMLAMVWMIIVMAPAAPAVAAIAGHAHHHGGLPVAQSLSGVALTAALLVSGVIFIVETALAGGAAEPGCASAGARTSWMRHRGDVASGAVMSLGMATMCWPMIAG